MKVVNAINIPFPSTVEIHFDQNLLIDEELLRASNYLFDKGAFTTSVVLINEKQVRVTVENLFENDTFTVSVTDQIKNTSGVGVDQFFNSATFSISNRPKPSDAFSSISAENGRLKSGIRAIQIQQLGDRWYIRTESGVDVVNNVSLANEGFVLDGYGFNTIFVG